jgi:uracil-DNA glycosylase
MNPATPAMPTWRRLYKLFERAEFNPQEMFFTNVYVSLKAGAAPEGKFPGAKDPSFCARCYAFLDEQIQIMRPRAVATLGATARNEFSPESGRITPVARAGAEFNTVVLTSRGVRPAGTR